MVGEVSDSLHLRGFCGIAPADQVPDEPTICKLLAHRVNGRDAVDWQPA